MTLPVSTVNNGLPLAGIRVLEFCHTIMGPSAGLILADLGADVIKIEPADGDPTRAKPAPTLYLEALSLLGVGTDEAVVFEDSPNGVASAEAAGCQVFAVPSLIPIPPGPGRIVVRSLRDLTAGADGIAVRKDSPNPGG